MSIHILYTPLALEFDGKILETGDRSDENQESIEGEFVVYRTNRLALAAINSLHTQL